MKDQSLRVLMVEDSENDELLIIRELKKGGYNPVYERVETAAAMKKALKEKQWDIILCDYKMPTFDGPSAIALLKEANINIPLIVVTGAIGEETAVKCMHLGAQDYIMKDNLSRLCPAIDRELKEAEVRNKQKQAEDALRESERKYHNLYHYAYVGLFETSMEEAKIIACNQCYCDLAGFPNVESAIGMDILQLYVNPDDREEVKKILRTQGYTTNHLLQLKNRLTDKVFWVEFSARVNPSRNIIEGSLIDVTERKQAEQMLKESERHLDQVLQFFPDPMLVIDRHGKVTTWNRHMEDLTGVKAENMLGKGDYEYALPFYGERRPILIDLAMEPNDKIEGRYDVIRRHNNTISGEAYMPHLGTGNTFISGRAEALYNSQGEIIGAIESIRDITERKQAQEALEQSEKRYRELSIIDNLTQLYNSMHFYQQLKMEIDRANRYKQPLTLLLLDLDDFKQLNDAYGHIEGDLVLSRVGQVIKRCMRQTDSAYRYGGEEFTILLPMSTGEDGAVMAERIRTEFKKEIFPPVSGKEDIHMTVSIGLAQYKPQEEMKAFVHRVDQLMYQAKKNGKDRVCSES
jgi:diguanylate cyclase (GGDEF)-like protein/PAS domain S-box-containing protein